MKTVLLALAVVVLSAQVSLAQDSKAIAPFNGKDLTGWKIKGKDEKSKWKVGTAVMDEKKQNQLVFTPVSADTKSPELVNTGTGVDISTEGKFGDCVFEVELMVPKGSNSGIYMMGEYEIQVLDSFGRAKVGPGDIGGLYNAAAPSVNAAKKPGEWQKFVIDFQAPKFDAAGKKSSNAKFVKVQLNDQVIHENIEMKGPTPGGLTGREAATGPIMFQGDHGPVSFRNLRVTAK